MKTLHWTRHSRAKMKFYKLSEARVKRVINSPKRIEEGIAPRTIAMMQPASVKTAAGKSASGGKWKREETWSQEIWVMVQEEKKRRKIISAWRYPGRTKPGQPLPEEIIREIKGLLDT